VQADGGDLVLVRADVETGVVEVQLQGACSSCAISSATLEGGVTRILMDRLDWVTQVLGGVDETMDPEDSMSLVRVATFLGIASSESRPALSPNLLSREVQKLSHVPSRRAII